MTATDVALIACHNVKLGGPAGSRFIRPGDSFVPPDRETALRALLSAGPAMRAIAAAGEERVTVAATGAIAPYRTSSGGYAIENVWRYLIATA